MTTIRTTAPQAHAIHLARLLAPYRVADILAARRMIRASRAQHQVAAITVQVRRSA